MLDINESVRHSALELSPQERADATAAYLKSFMFKGHELQKQPITYDAPIVGDHTPQPGIDRTSITTNMPVGAAIMNPMLTENIKNNTGVNFSPADVIAAYTSGIGTDREYDVDLSSEVAVIRAIGSNFFAYNPGYDYYGPVFTEYDEISYQTRASHLLVGSSYTVKNSAQSFHKWTFLHEDLDVRERCNASTSLSNNAKLQAAKERPVTNLCFAHAAGISDPMSDQEVGKQALSFSIFDNSRFKYDPVVGGPYRSDEADEVIYSSGIQAVRNVGIMAGRVGPITQRAKHEAGLSWMGYQYAISTKSISVSNDGFESVVEVNEPFTGYWKDSTALISDAAPNISVYPTDSGVIIHPNYGPNYITMTGAVVKDSTSVNTLSHFLKWQDYTVTMGPDDDTHGYGKYITECEVNGLVSALPVGVDFQNTHYPEAQVSYWMTTIVGKNPDNTLPSTGAAMVSLLGANLAVDSPTLNLATSALALDRTRAIVSPLREVYCSTDDGNFCLIPVAGFILEDGSYPMTIPAVMVIHKETGISSIVDVHGFKDSTDPGQLSTPALASSMVDIDGHLGFIGIAFQYVLKPGADPRLPQSWVEVNIDWVGSFADSGVEEPVLEESEDTKYSMHDTVFTTSAGAVYKYGAMNPSSNYALGTDFLSLDATGQMGEEYDCYTVTDYARYPAIPTALSGSSTNMIAYPMLRKFAPTGTTDGALLFPQEPDWEGFYFSTGLMRLEVPILKYASGSAVYESNWGYASRWSQSKRSYPSESATIFQPTSRPKVTGGFCILPKDKLIGKSIRYAQQA